MSSITTHIYFPSLGIKSLGEVEGPLSPGITNLLPPRVGCGPGTGDPRFLGARAPATLLTCSSTLELFPGNVSSIQRSNKGLLGIFHVPGLAVGTGMHRE